MHAAPQWKGKNLRIIPCDSPNFCGKRRNFAALLPSPQRAFLQDGLNLRRIDSNRRTVSRDYLSRRNLPAPAAFLRRDGFNGSVHSTQVTAAAGEHGWRAGFRPPADCGHWLRRSNDRPSSCGFASVFVFLHRNGRGSATRRVLMPLCSPGLPVTCASRGGREHSCNLSKSGLGLVFIIVLRSSRRLTFVH
jgi:hypothetical protein